VNDAKLSHGHTPTLFYNTKILMLCERRVFIWKLTHQVSDNHLIFDPVKFLRGFCELQATYYSRLFPLKTEQGKIFWSVPQPEDRTAGPLDTGIATMTLFQLAPSYGCVAYGQVRAPREGRKSYDVVWIRANLAKKLDFTHAIAAEHFFLVAEIQNSINYAPADIRKMERRNCWRLLFYGGSLLSDDSYARAVWNAVKSVAKDDRWMLVSWDVNGRSLVAWPNALNRESHLRPMPVELDR
jgi:hypothetical protein